MTRVGVKVAVMVVIVSWGLVKHNRFYFFVLYLIGVIFLNFLKCFRNF